MGARRHRHRQGRVLRRQRRAALLDHTRDLFFLGDGDLAVLTRRRTRHRFRRQPGGAQGAAYHWDPIMAEKAL